MFEHGDSDNGFSIKAHGHSDGINNDWSVRAEGRWQDNAACEMWKRPNDPDSTFKLPERIDEPTKKDIDRVIFPNGDHFSVNENGRWKYVDSNGDPITKEMPLTTPGEIGGTMKYLMSNGATLNLGEFSNSIKYPNGDSVSWARNGDIQMVNLKDKHEGHGMNLKDRDEGHGLEQFEAEMKARLKVFGGSAKAGGKITGEAFEEMRSQLDVPPIDFRGISK